MFAAVYRWGVIAGREADFEEGWRRGTIAIRKELGGMGSRLHRCANGDYFAYAQWPDEETWRRAVKSGMPHSDSEARMMYRVGIARGEFDTLITGETCLDLLDPAEQ